MKIWHLQDFREDLTGDGKLGSGIGQVGIGLGLEVRKFWFEVWMS